MRSLLKHVINTYIAIDDEIIVIKRGVVHVYAIDRKLAVDVASWLVRHMADRNFELSVKERFMDWEVSLVRRN